MLSMPENDSNITVSDNTNTKCSPSSNDFSSKMKKKKRKKDKKNGNVSIDEDLIESNVLSNKQSKSLLQAKENAESISCEDENMKPQVKVKNKKKKKEQKDINESKIHESKNQVGNVFNTDRILMHPQSTSPEPEAESRIPKQKKKKRSHEESVDEEKKLVDHNEDDGTVLKKKCKKRKIKQDEIPKSKKQSNGENSSDASENVADASENGANASENGADASENGADEDPTLSSQMPSCSLQVTENDIETSLAGKLTDCKYFSDMQAVLSAPTMTAIESLGFTELTEIQARAIPPLLEGKDLRGTAKTGSGKTIAFLIPAFELLHRLEFKQHHGTGVIILCPTRELAMQTFGVTQILGDRHNMSYGLLIGGANRAAESKALKQGNLKHGLSSLSWQTFLFGLAPSPCVLMVWCVV
ncbi:DEAD/DEAH box helicase domain [Trinorchestia longiramus]|nr:DEAD/DEAH box helicase domain [Trinorchestia longiramus]